MEISKCAKCGYELYPMDEECPKCGEKVVKINISPSPEPVPVIKTETPAPAAAFPRKRHIIMDSPILFAFLVLIWSDILIAVLTLILEIFWHTKFGGMAYAIKSLIANVIPVCFISYRANKRLLGDLPIGFTKVRLMESLHLSVPLIIFIIIEVISNLIISVAGNITVSTSIYTVITNIINGLIPGISEEVLFRSIILGNMMRLWNKDKDGTGRAIFWSSLIFGMAHFSNVLLSMFTEQQNFENVYQRVLLQVLYAFGFGMALGAIYIRTRNIWGAVIAHFLMDATTFIMLGGNTVIEGLTENYSRDVSVTTVVSNVITAIFGISIGLYQLRKSKNAEIKQLWAEDRAKKISFDWK